VERNLVESANAERCESPFVLQPAERALSGSPDTVEVVCCQHLDEPVHVAYGVRKSGSVDVIPLFCR
jgi:hypothetical protein